VSRLPVPGQDDGMWGDILNDFLGQALAADGTLKSGSVGTAHLQGGSVTNAKLDVATQTTLATVSSKYTKPASGIPKSDLSSSVQQSLDNADAAAAGSTPDASSSIKGIIQLAGDLGGTAASPTVPGLSAKEPKLTAGTTSQYYRGDKSWQALDKVVVGLTNVDNTSDINKPISSATQTALNAKADDTTVLHAAGTETVTGAKNFTGGVTINGTNIVVTSDTRLTDQRVPTDGSVSDAKITSGGLTNAALSSSAAIARTKFDAGTQTSLAKADTAYQKPGSGIPTTDLSSGVQTSLGLANSSIQQVNGKTPTGGTVTLTPADFGAPTKGYVIAMSIAL
jgi:hypothetical protein